MTYCINPWCKSRENNIEAEFCAACQQPLLVNGRFKCLSPIVTTSRERKTEVIEAIDTLGSFVNLPGGKVILKTLIDDDLKIEELFRREAESLSCFDHPGIPKADVDNLFHFQVRNGDEFMCFYMTKIEGINLEEWIKSNGAVNQETALDWLVQISEILQEVHGKGYMHRDIKPSNIMVQPDKRIALIDFGAVRSFNETYLARLAMQGYGLTQVHTIGYSPAEQMNGRALPQSDFYAVGRTLIYCVTGQHFLEIPVSQTTGELLWRQKAKQTNSLFSELVKHLTAADPRNRPKNAQEMSSAAIDVLELKNRPLKLSLRLIKKLNKFYYITPVTLVLITFLGLFFNNSKSKYYYAEQLLSTASARPVTGEWNELKSNLEEYIAQHPSARDYNQFGILCRRMLDVNCAEEQFKKAIEFQPVYLEPYMRLGNLYEDIGKFEDAKQVYQNAALSSQGKEILPYVNLSRINLLFSNLVDANSNLQKAFTFKAIPKKILRTLNKNQAWLKLEENQYQEAIRYAEKAIQIDSQYASAYCIAAIAQYKLNKRDQEFREDCMFMASEDANYPEVRAWRRQIFDTKK